MTDADGADPAHLDAGFMLGPVRVEPRRNLVVDADGAEQRLEPRAMAALVHLARVDGVVRRDELIDAVWRTMVSDEVVSRAISLIRQALGDRARDPRYVETIPKVGYRLIVPAGPLPAAEPQADPETHDGAGAIATPKDATADAVPPAVADPVTTSPAEAPGPAAADRETPAAPAAVEHRPAKRWLSLAMLAGAALALLFVTLSDRTPVDDGATLTVAVLPLADTLLHEAAQPIGVGLADALRAELGRSNGLRVLARSSSIAIAQEAADARVLGERFGIDRVVEGSVLQAADRLVVQLSISDAGSGLQQWAETFEGRPEDLFGLGGEIVAAMATALPGVDARPARPAPSEGAYASYVQGLHYLGERGEAGLARADALFTAALEADPAFDLARVALARTRALAPYWSRRAEAEVFPEALAILAAIRSDEALVRGIEAGVRGFIAFRSWDWSAAEAHFARALELAPQDAGIRAWYAQYLAATGDAAGSLEQALEAWDLDPGSPIVGSRVAAAYLWLGQPRAAEPYYDVTDPQTLASRDPSYLIWLIELGRAEEAGRLLAGLQRAAGLDDSWIPAAVTLIDGAPGRDAALETMLAAIDAGEVLPQLLQPIWILAGEFERAHGVLDRFRDQRQLFQIEFLHAPQAAAFRAHPAFERTLEVIGQR